jgi:hypothetical protein
LFTIETVTSYSLPGSRKLLLRDAEPAVVLVIAAAGSTGFVVAHS